MIRYLCHIKSMPSKLLLRNFEQNTYYHIRHQGKKGTILFQNDNDYKTFIVLLPYYLRFPDATPLSWVKRLTPQTVINKRNASELGASPVTLHSFLILPDHFHLVLKENQGTKKPGISNLMRRLSVGYAMYYNKTYGVTGTIYQGKYKMTPVAQNDLYSLINTLHHHEEVNDTFLISALHSSRSDYFATPRPWVALIPKTDSTPISKTLLLEK
jgi:REP element-mobilizing transposase RayT